MSPSEQEAADARDEALKAVDRHADTRWKLDALAAVELTCRTLPEFMVDDVWETGRLESTREDRAMGAVMRAAARNGWCVKTNLMRPSKRSHLSGKPVWRSLIFGHVVPVLAPPDWYPPPPVASGASDSLF